MALLCISTMVQYVYAMKRGVLQVDIVRFKGGLGNQMFQYAFLEALRNEGRVVKTSLGGYEKNVSSRCFSLNKVFSNISLDLVSNEEFQVIDQEWKDLKEKTGESGNYFECYEEQFFWIEDVERQACTYQPNVFKTKNCVFVGYWQSEKYFKNIRSFLLDKFVFTNISEELEAVSSVLSTQQYISVHIRRGDYLQYPDTYMGICTPEYYNQAIQYFVETLEMRYFVFFSDDMEWVKNNFAIPNAIYCGRDMFDKYEDWYDLYLMTNCKHNIIANSSFSWWGAWLNQSEDKVVIAPKKWHANNPTPDIWCDDWIRI